MIRLLSRDTTSYRVNILRDSVVSSTHRSILARGYLTSLTIPVSRIALPLLLLISKDSFWVDTSHHLKPIEDINRRKPRVAMETIYRILP